jgi:dipeptidase D
LHNVLIKKNATPDRADDAPLMFQGHTDMVCVKTADCDIDFMKDGLSLYIDGDFLRAKGTTLGADDGIAVATMLALLDGALSSHPALECLFTSAEEVGLDGADGFDYSKLPTEFQKVTVEPKKAELKKAIKDGQGFAGVFLSKNTSTIIK